MKKIIIASVVAGLMVTSLSADLTENEATQSETVKNESGFANASNLKILVNKPSDLSLWAIE